MPTTDDAGDALFSLGTATSLSQLSLAPSIDLADGRYVLTVQLYRDGTILGRTFAAPLLVGTAVTTPAPSAGSGSGTTPGTTPGIAPGSTTGIAPGTTPGTATGSGGSTSGSGGSGVTTPVVVTVPAGSDSCGRRSSPRWAPSGR